MIVNSTISNSNQLKLNLDALVSNLNLVNIIHQPKPIVIENVNNKHLNNDYNQTYSNNGYNLIDENKLKMFSFLAERKLKEKEWHSKYFGENTVVKPSPKEPINSNNKKILPKNPVNKQSVNPSNNARAETPTERNKSAKNCDEKMHKNAYILFNIAPLDVKMKEIQAICKQLMITVENLEKILVECKRLVSSFFFVVFSSFKLFKIKKKGLKLTIWIYKKKQNK
jgi:hypothetical protein